MHRVSVIVFEDEAKAEAGKTELLRLDGEGAVGIYGYVVIAKHADGAVVMREADGRGTLSHFTKSLLGRLSDSKCSIPGPAATKVGAQDSDKTETGEDFLSDVVEVMLPNRVAIVAETEEEWPTVLDRHMESVGGTVFRWTVSDVPHAIEM